MRSNRGARYLALRRGAFETKRLPGAALQTAKAARHEAKTADPRPPDDLMARKWARYGEMD
jgi:hypothetical protein